MLKLALEARLPLIAVRTKDVLNLPAVIEHLTKQTPHAFKANTKPTPTTVYVHICQPGTEVQYLQAYEQFMPLESTLVVVNPPRMDPLLFDAGEVPVPKALLREFMGHVTDDKKKAEQYMRVLGGCTIKEAAEMVRLTTARDHAITPDGLLHTRKTSFQGQNGLTLVDAAQEFYNAPSELLQWLNEDSTFFLQPPEPRLMPRGLLFDGPPGTGKTSGAKWIAYQLGVPLYRFDIGGTKNKYVGESEQQMIANLRRLDAEEPCVALFDEVEKVFATSNNDTSGTTATMLSQMLWWLAEHKSRVFVIMTTNDVEKLPKELYRPGRIDRTMTFNGVPHTDVKAFVQDLAWTFKFVNDGDEVKIADAVYNEVYKGNGMGVSMTPKPQALLTELTFKEVKKLIAAKQ